ncbi:MAG: tetratricopeptide repeat protein [Bacteroidales bacterium]|nr:tetratricopeptide repeat protein [Bacteroidales bacterium]
MKREWCFVLVIVLLCSCSNGKSPKQGSEQGTKVLIEQLEHTYQQGDWETTLLLIDSLRKMDAYGNIQPIEAECYIGLGDYDKAIALLTDVVEEGTAHNIYYHYNALGTAYYYKGDLDQAAEMYKKSIELRPTYARPYIHLGNLYAQQGDKEESIRYYLQAISLFAENRFYAEVIEYANIVLEMDVTNIEALNLKQYALFTTGEYREALTIGGYLDELLEKLEQWEERHINWLFTGLSAYQCGEYTLARDLIGNAMRYQEVVQVYGWLGYCYLSAAYTKLGDENLAEQAKAAAKSIDAEGVDECIKELLAGGDEE